MLKSLVFFFETKEFSVDYAQTALVFVKEFSIDYAQTALVFLATHFWLTYHMVFFFLKFGVIYKMWSILSASYNCHFSPYSFH
jgi:hypothetical protein